MNQVSPRLTNRMKTLLSISSLSLAAVDTLEIKINQLFGLIVPKIISEEIPPSVLAELVELDGSVQHLLINEYESQQLYKNMTKTVNTDSKANMVCEIIRSSTEFSAVKSKAKLLQIEEFQSSIRQKYKCLADA